MALILRACSDGLHSSVYKKNPFCMFHKSSPLDSLVYGLNSCAFLNSFYREIVHYNLDRELQDPSEVPEINVYIYRMKCKI